MSFLKPLIGNFGNFSAIQISREINFCELGVSNFAIMADSAPLDFGFREFLHFARVENEQKSKLRAFRIVEMAVFDHLKSGKIIFT